MESHEISLQLLKVYDCVDEHGTWITNKAIAAKTGIPPRTVRHNTRGLADRGIIEEMRTSPDFVYRIAENAWEHHPQYLTGLEQAREVFGVVAK